MALLSQWYSADSLSVVGSIATTLRTLGAEVAVYTGGDYAPDWSRGSPQRSVIRTSIAGVPITRYPYFRSHEPSAIKRALSYTSFAASSTALSARELSRHDVVLVYSSPATAASAAVAASLRFSTPFVLLIQDLWPDSVYATGYLNGPRTRRAIDATLGRFVNCSYRLSSAVVGISPAMRDVLIMRGVAPAKAHFVYNWAADETDAALLPTPELDRPLHLMYAGTLGFAQNLDNVLEALALLPPESVTLTLLGAGAAETRLRAKADALSLANVRFLGRVPKHEVPKVQATANLHLISLANEELFRITVPSKLQALAAHGAPSLCVAPGEVARLVESSGMGIACPPGDPLALARAIDAATRLSFDDLARMGRNARALYSNELSAAINGQRLHHILETAVVRR